MSDRWDNFFLQLSFENAMMSKDPSTQVGAIIVNKHKTVLAMGFNGFPRGIADTEERLINREEKLQLVVHAEMNAIVSAARNGVSIRGTTMYLMARDISGSVWGGPPCTRCIVHVIQSGITSIVTLPMKNVPSKWKTDIENSLKLLQEAGISYREILSFR